MVDTGCWMVNIGYKDTATGGSLSEFVESG